jgi:hypothetical protein
VAAFDKDRGALLDRKLAALELGDERQLLRLEVAEDFERTQRTFLARVAARRHASSTDLSRQTSPPRVRRTERMGYS